MPRPTPDPSDTSNEGSESATPPEFTLAEDFVSELEAQPADERVYRVALQLYEPARVAVIAERAACSSDTARRHLERLEEIGVVERNSDSPATFSRNESYFDWRKTNRLERLSDADLSERLGDLTDREASFRETYDADAPGNVDALDHADYHEVEDVWMDLSEWQTVRDRIRRIERVRQNRLSEPGIV